MPSTPETATAPVPLVNLGAQDGPLTDELVAAVRDLVERTAYIGGPPVEQFEAAIAERLGVKHAVAVNSGTDAIALGLIGLGVGPGSAVVLPAFTYNATAAAVVRAGGRPVLADVDPVTLNLDPQALISTASAVGGVQAAVVVHLFGHPADMDGCTAAAEACGIALFEDAAQSIGASWKGTPTGRLAHAAGFSFYPTKNLGACGDAGILTTDDDEVALTARTLRNQGVTPGTDKYTHALPGWNSRMDAFQAAVLGVKLPHLDGWNDGRRAVAERYRGMLDAAGLSGQVRCPPGDGDAHPVYHLFCVRAERRDALREHLVSRNIGCAVYYATPVHLQPCWADLGYTRGDFPVAEAASADILALPCWPGLPGADQQRVVDAIADFYRD